MVSNTPGRSARPTSRVAMRSRCAGFQSVDSSAQTLSRIVRAVTAVPGHAIFGVFMGYFYGYAKLSDYWGRDEDRKAYLALSVVVPILLHGCYDFLAFAQEGDSRFTLLFYAYLIALYVFGIRRVNRSSRDDRRVTRETVFDYFRRMQYPLPPQYRDRNDDFWR